MNKLILNQTNEFTIESYSRNTTYDADGNLSSYASISLPDSSDYDSLVALSHDTITDIVIASMTGASIYHLANQNAKITSIYENLLSDDKMAINVNIQFEEMVEEPA